MHAHAPGADWWEDPALLARYVADLLAAELAQARPGRPLPLAPPWPARLDLVRELGADSLELLGMASALAEALDLGRAAGPADPSDAGERLLARPLLEDWVASARAGLRAGCMRLGFRTSGSAGTPKRCVHPLATLWQETEALAALLPGRRRILSAVPAHHIYGFLFTVLLPRRLGIAEVLDLRACAPAAAAAMLREGDLVVAHPGWWEALSRLDPRFAAGIAGVSSGAPCADPLAARLGDAGLRLLQVYGSSETAGVGWRDRAGAPFALLPYWARADDEAVLVRALPGGGAVRYPLQDRLAWEDGGFRPLGRIDRAVQVGGSNVHPAYVAEVLCLHPRVAEAAVRLMRPDEGSRLKAFVVARGEASEALRTELLAWCAARLGVAERPAALSFGARLPRQASGKPADWIIDAL